MMLKDVHSQTGEISEDVGISQLIQGQKGPFAMARPC